MKKKTKIIISAGLAVSLIVCGVIFLTKFADKVYKPDIPSVPTAEISSTLKPPETESQTEKGSVNKTEIIIKNEKHSFTVVKTDFEKRFSEEELYEMSSVISMSFGYEDYYNWNGEAEFVVNELINNCLSTPFKWPFKSIITEDEEIIEKASKELSVYMDDENAKVDYGIAELDVLNAYIKDMYGENARTFTGKDFMSVDEALKNNGKVFDYHSDGYSQIRYFPENNLVWIASRDTGWNSITSYIYDIKEVNGDYIVYTISEVEDFNSDSFSSQQKSALDYSEYGRDKWLPANVYTLGVSENGDFYLKSVEKKCIFADGFSGEYVLNDDADLFDKKIYSQPPEKAGTVKKGTVVSLGPNYSEDGYKYIINEDFSGYVDPKYLDEIA